MMSSTNGTQDVGENLGSGDAGLSYQNELILEDNCPHHPIELPHCY